MIYCLKGFYIKVPAKPCLTRHNFHLSINDNKGYCVSYY